MLMCPRCGCWDQECECDIEKITIHDEKYVKLVAEIGRLRQHYMDVAKGLILSKEDLPKYNIFGIIAYERDIERMQERVTALLFIQEYIKTLEELDNG